MSKRAKAIGGATLAVAFLAAGYAWAQHCFYAVACTVSSSGGAECTTVLWVCI